MTVLRIGLMRAPTGALAVTGMAAGATALARTPGVTDDEILIANAMPYSGSASFTARYLRDPSDHGEDAHPGMQEYKAWHAKHFSDQDINDAIVGYSGAQMLVHVLEQAGDDPSRENVMKVAASMDFVLPLLYDGICVKTGPDDYQPIEALQLVRFTGKGFERADGVIGQ